MRLVVPLLFLLLLPAIPAEAARKSVTLYLDGARIEESCATTGKSVEFPLPAAMLAGSLRIKPLAGNSIELVEVLPARPEAKRSREAARLTARREALADRLQALDAREAIFKAAAKSQSGKAPRKTKANPDPLASVRQGTEYAIAQLEEVYRARRVATNELRSLDLRLAALKGEGNGAVVRIRLARANGRFSVSYLRNDLRWAPCYDFRINRSGAVDVVLRAILPVVGKGTTVAVVPSLLGEASDAATFPVEASSLPQVAAFTFTVEHETYAPTPLSSLSFSFRNQSALKLPAGEAACYLRGEYLGKAAFAGSPPGAAGELTFGSVAPQQ